MVYYFKKESRGHIMTESQALQEAKDRWGKDGRIEEVSRHKKSSKQSNAPENADIQYRVGIIKIRPVWGTVFEVKGYGTTWEEAFKNVDNRKQFDLKEGNKKG
jgi:predicted membrane-bound mannosyltransferase